MNLRLHSLSLSLLLPLLCSCVASGAVSSVPADEYTVHQSKRLPGNKWLIVTNQADWDYLSVYINPTSFEPTTATLALPERPPDGSPVSAHRDIVFAGPEGERITVSMTAVCRMRGHRELDRQWEWGPPGALLLYPLTGLPRDLLDIPFTALNQLGMGSDGYLKDGPGGFVWPMMAAGIVVPVVLLFPPASAAPVLYVAMIPAAAAGAFAGFVVGVWMNQAYWALRGLQTRVLRGGVDAQVPYLNAVKLPNGIWTNHELEEYNRIRRAHAFFPIWRFKTNRNPLTLREKENAGEGIWVLDELIIRTRSVSDGRQ